MDFQDEHSIINLKFMKITGIYQLIRPSDSLKLFNMNIYKMSFIAQIQILSIITIMSLYSIYSCINDVNQIFNYSVMIFATNFAIYKYYFIIKNAKTIWNFTHNMMSTNFLCYKDHTKEIYKVARTRSSTITLISLALWSFIVLYWSLSPILSNNSYLKVKFENGVQGYRLNALGLVYPVTDTFYNKYFHVFYIIETIALICWAQMMWVFDILMISVCISIEYQLKTIAESYSGLGLNHSELTSNNKSTKSVEAISDLEVLVQDQQNIYEKMKNMYQILKPFTFIQVAAESFQIILQSCMILKFYFDGSLTLTFFLKFLFPEITYSCHLFLTCYLYSIVNEQKESMNFALYNSNWTDMSIKFKKLLLLIMRMNNAENLKMKISMKRMVNMEMFADVMHTAYRIISVMMNSYST
ncbi:unnamed protein product [Macrosiphum euphorbiae]|uniref:Odorant receptor n=1 Tax=Macrosiphum euphorbiae TaxID=13131 RepID=A0AAV0VXY9_9HEMI|nr:unnamed protein product [Macrosiphum euphorbiae]